MITTLHIGTSIVYRTPIAAEDGLTARQCERRAVSRLVEYAFGTDCLLHNEDGAPYIAGGVAPHISVSHGAGEALLAVNFERRVGVDIESPRQQLDRVKHKFLHRCELPEYGGSIGGLLKAWTMKEAVYKALSVRGVPLTEIRLPVGGAEPVAVCAVRGADVRRFAVYGVSEPGRMISLVEEILVV